MKLIVKIIIIIVIFAAGFYVGQQVALAPSSGNQNLPAAVQIQGIKATLILNYGQEKTKSFANITLPAAATGFDLLKKISAENNFTVNYKDYGGGMGVFITAIDGVVNNQAGNRYWQFWVNGKYSKVGASSVKLSNGDIVEWRYTNDQYK